MYIIDINNTAVQKPCFCFVLFSPRMSYKHGGKKGGYKYSLIKNNMFIV